MTRRSLLKYFGLAGTAALLAKTHIGAAAEATSSFTKAQWKKLLPPASYEVLFEEDTERAGSSPLNHEKREGSFVCAACYNPLFPSQNKFDSGTGWPSFFKAREGAVATRTDFKLIYPRKEYHCAHCGGHQGHLFDDGPAPTGQRYCNNGLALRFIPKAEALPALRS